MASHGVNTPSNVNTTSNSAQGNGQGGSGSQNAPSSSWTEPPWCGWIETTGDALIILEAARRGLIPRVTRRLVDSERKMIVSGSVFVFDEDESGIKRWTDGFFWSPSRILGNFLLYRETDKRGAGHRGGARGGDQESTSASLLVNEQGSSSSGVGVGGAGVAKNEQSLSRPKGELGALGIDKARERSLVGSLTNSYKFKPDGMMKKTFSLTINGVAQHLISYYKVEDVEQGRLRTPSSLPELASLDISPEYLDKTHFRNPPKVDYDIDGIPRYRGEADEADPSPRATISAPLSTGQPLLLESRAGVDGEGGVGKRGSKRYDPYGTSGAGQKRPRKVKGAQHQHTSSGGGGSGGGGAAGGDSHSTGGSQHSHSQSPTIPGQAPSGLYAGAAGTATAVDMASHSHSHHHAAAAAAAHAHHSHSHHHAGYPQQYGLSYYHPPAHPQYSMGPPHVYSAASGSTSAGTTQAGTPPPPHAPPTASASGIVSPAPSSTQLAYTGYAPGPPSTGGEAASSAGPSSSTGGGGGATTSPGGTGGSGTSASQSYAYYSTGATTPAAAATHHGHYATTYGGVTWTPYTFTSGGPTGQGGGGAGQVEGKGGDAGGVGGGVPGVAQSVGAAEDA